jgi:hypothetical protein
MEANQRDWPKSDIITGKQPLKIIKQLIKAAQIALPFLFCRRMIYLRILTSFLHSISIHRATLFIT